MMDCIHDFEGEIFTDKFLILIFEKTIKRGGLLTLSIFN